MALCFYGYVALWLYEFTVLLLYILRIYKLQKMFKLSKVRETCHTSASLRKTSKSKSASSFNRSGSLQQQRKRTLSKKEDKNDINQNKGNSQKQNRNSSKLWIQKERRLLKIAPNSNKISSVFDPTKNPNNLFLENLKAREYIQKLKKQNNEIKSSIQKQRAIQTIFVKRGLYSPLESLEKRQISEMILMNDRQKLAQKLQKIEIDQKFLRQKIQSSNSKFIATSKAISDEFLDKYNKIYFLLNQGEKMYSQRNFQFYCQHLQQIIYKNKDKIQQKNEAIKKIRTRKQKTLQKLNEVFGSYQVANVIFARAKQLSNKQLNDKEKIEFDISKHRATNLLENQIKNIQNSQKQVQRKMREMMDNKIKSKVILLRRIQDTNESQFLAQMLFKLGKAEQNDLQCDLECVMETQTYKEIKFGIPCRKLAK